MIPTHILQCEMDFTMQKYTILMIRANFALNNLVVYNKSPIFASSFFCLTLNLKAMGMNRKFNMGKKNEINPNFNPLEFEGFRKEAGLNAFTLSPTHKLSYSHRCDQESSYS